MANEKLITLELLGYNNEKIKAIIEAGDAKAIKSADYSNNTLSFYTTVDKSGDAVATLNLPEEQFLDQTKTVFVNNFVWSDSTYPNSTDPSLDGKPVLVLAVKGDTDVAYSFVSLESLIDIVTGEVTVPTKADINTIFIPYNYNPDPKYSPRIDQFMKDVCDGDILKMQFLYQIAGYCLLKKNMFQKFFLFKGEGGTGKSTYMNLIHMMVGGDTNCAHVGLSDFDKDYYLATLLSKLVNIDDDVVDGKALENTGRFKSTISGDIISVRQIYEPVISFKPYCTCIFSCNRLPRIMDKTSGLLRRLVLVELNHKVANPDPLFLNKITEEDMEYFLFKAVEGIMIAIQEGHFRIEKSDAELLKLFQRRQSPINEWLYDSNITLGDLQDKPCLNLYPQFTAWCNLNGYTKPMSMFSFKEEICALYNMTIEFKVPDGGITPKAVFYRHGDFDPTYKPF